jgi:hypothetical protein
MRKVWLQTFSRQVFRPQRAFGTKTLQMLLVPIILAQPNRGPAIVEQGIIIELQR